MTSNAEKSDEDVIAVTQQVRSGHVLYMRSSLKDAEITQYIFCVTRQEDVGRVA